MAFYFYRDPLEAAIMAQRYGMRFDVAGRADPVDARDLLDAAPSSWSVKRFIVRPESLPLLQPQLGDLIERADCFHFVVTAEEHEDAEGVSSFANQTVALGEARSRRDMEGTFIRMRGGREFIHPEREIR